MLCEYKDALGKPGEGIHSWRVPPGLAGFDLLLTAGAALLLSHTLLSGTVVSFLIALVILIVIAVIVHRAFCVNTALNTWLGLAVNDGVKTMGVERYPLLSKTTPDSTTEPLLLTRTT